MLLGEPISPIIIEISRFSEIFCIFNTCRQTNTYKMSFNSPFQDESNGLGLGTVRCVFQTVKKIDPTVKEIRKNGKNTFFPLQVTVSIAQRSVFVRFCSNQRQIEDN